MVLPLALNNSRKWNPSWDWAGFRGTFICFLREHVFLLDKSSC